MKPEVIVAITASITSLIIAGLSFRGTRINERKRLKDEIVNKEFQARLNALHIAIETTQTLKNELRYLIHEINYSNDKDAKELIENISKIIKLFDSKFSSKRSSLVPEEIRMLHDLMHLFNDMRLTLENYYKRDKRSRTKDKDRIIKIAQAMRNELSNYQQSYQDVRSRLLINH
jgi:hypothetical protein